MDADVGLEVLGLCPACGAVVHAEDLLAKYEPPGGWPRIVGECPGCARLCHPR